MVAYFPFTKDGIVSNYRPLLEGKEKKSDMYVKYFMSKVNDYLEPISKKDASMFQQPNVILIQGVDFHQLWNSPESNPKNQQATWKYLQLLTLLGRRIIPNQSEIVKMLKIVGGTIETPQKVDATLNKKDEEIENENTNPSGVEGLLNMAGDLTGLGDLGNLGALGGLSNLMGGASGDANPLADIGKVAEGINEMMKNIDMEAISKNLAESMKQAQEELAKAKANVESNSDGNSETNIESESNIISNSEDSESLDISDATNSAESSNTSTSNDANASSGNAGNAANPTNPMEGLGGLLGGSLFTDLAKEMTETFDFEELEKQEQAGNPPDMATAFSTFMSGDNSKKLMNMVGKFGAKLQGEMSNGNIDEAALRRQTDQMMGGQMGQMAQQMASSMASGGGANLNGQNISNKQMKEAAERLANDPRTQRRVQEANRANNTRDRLRAKLAAKQASQQSS
tara:strand:- start:2803 stop:4173 length:1371 start_codon:yes stop_codon:yes gene_type:complete